VVATLTMLTARTVAAAVLVLGATEVIASGGTRNPVLMGMLGERLPGVSVRTSDALGLASAAKEAYAFAVLGFLTWHGLPGTVPVSTGARHPSVLGSVTPGRGDCGCRRRAGGPRTGWSWPEVRILSSRFHRRLIRWGHDAGDSSRVVSRPGADK